MKKPKKRRLSLKKMTEKGEPYIEKRIEEMFKDWEKTGKPIHIKITL